MIQAASNYLQYFELLIFSLRVIVLAKVVTMGMGINVNLSISVWIRRVDAISWSVFEQVITPVQIFTYNVCTSAASFHFAVLS